LLLGYRLVSKRLPKDVVELIGSYCKIGLTLAEAKEHRLKLMQERKVFINAQNEEMEREYSLCEH